MSMVEMICMANSYKHGGRCVAGLRTDRLRWVRPVNPGHVTKALSPQAYRLQSGGETQPLDLVLVPLQGPAPAPHQPENWELGAAPWQLLQRPAPEELLNRLFSLQPEEAALLGTYTDRVSYASLVKGGGSGSLAMVVPEQPRWKVTLSFRGLPQLRAVFSWQGTAYDLVVTDPRWKRFLEQYPEGCYIIRGRDELAFSRLLFTVSLGEPLNGFCFKLVSGVLWVPPACGGGYPGSADFDVEAVNKGADSSPMLLEWDDVPF